ncbi:MAG: PEP-CTERM sorting domain-containing protein [Phycisphaerales bacterium]|nr:PEP-CTERM sorting domain-containing protein [Phycisphaerales bacterium]
MSNAQIRARLTIRAFGLAALIIAAALAPAADGATISAAAWGASPSTDGSIDWSLGNTGFSHAISFGPAATDIVYTAADGYGLTGPTTMTFYGATGNYSGPGGSITLNTTNSLNNGAQTIGQITQEFVYGGNAGNSALSLSGLSPNTDYELTLYQANAFSGKLIDFSFDNTGVADATLTGVDRGNTKITVNYTTGSNTSVTLHTDAQSNNDTLHWYAMSNAVSILAPTAAMIGPGADITDANKQDTPGAERLNVDTSTSALLAAGEYNVTDWQLNVYENTQGGTITPILLTGSPSSYTTLWVGSAFDPTVDGVQMVPETGTFTLAAPTIVYAGFFTEGLGSGIIALNDNNSGSGSSSTDHDANGFTVPTGAGQPVDSISHPGLNRTYAFEINVDPVPEPATMSLLALGGLAILRRRRK